MDDGVAERGGDVDACGAAGKNGKTQFFAGATMPLSQDHMQVSHVTFT